MSYWECQKCGAIPGVTFQCQCRKGEGMSDDIKLPPLPPCPIWVPDGKGPELAKLLRFVQREAIAHDRQQRGTVEGKSCGDDSAVRQALVAASNYIDTLGGNSKSYRAALAAQKAGDGDAMARFLGTLRYGLGLIETDPDSDLSASASRTLEWARQQIDAAMQHKSQEGE